jgi:hypothetical protein
MLGVHAGDRTAVDPRCPIAPIGLTVPAAFLATEPTVKFYKRNPRAALTGMAELSFAQRGAYNSILDLLYDRDGLVPDDDHAIAHMIACDVRSWRPLKAQLMALGKIRLRDGFILANGVSECMILAQSRSTQARLAAHSRWKRYEITREINGAIRNEQSGRNAIQNTDIKKRPEPSLGRPPTEAEIASLRRLGALP